MVTISSGIAWFKATFGARVAAGTRDKPYSLDLFAALAVQESFEIWGGMFASEKEERILPLCVGDVLDRSEAFPTTKAELLKAPEGDKAFRIARISLEALVSHNSAYAKAAKNPDKFCHGFGVFQYDIQHFKKTDPGFFLDLKWFDFANCLEKAIGELDEAKNALYGPKKSSLTDDEMVYVAIGYNQGAKRTNIHGDFKQGHKDKSSGKYYGEFIWEYLQIAHGIPFAGGAKVARDRRITRELGSSLAQAAPPIGAGGVLKTVKDEWNALIPFVSKNVGGGRLSDWVDIRDLMLDAFEAPGDPDLAVKRINDYYGAFVVGKLRPGGAGMRVHKDMKDRMDTVRALLNRVGAADRLDNVKSVGGFNIRRNTNNKAQLSNHSFGLAIDLDPALNPNLPLSSPVGERKRWGVLVEFLTGTHPYGSESVRLQTARSYIKCLPDVVTLCQASARFVAACSAPEHFATAVQAGLRRNFGLNVPLDDCVALAALAGRHDHAAMQAKLGQLQVPTTKAAAMADLLVYGQSVATASQAKGLKPETSGTAATTARFGFIDLAAEVIAGLAASDGGGLRWLGSATGIKDYMHFDFRDSDRPPLVPRNA